MTGWQHAADGLKPGRYTADKVRLDKRQCRASNWNDANNWNSGQIPTSSDSVVVKQNGSGNLLHINSQIQALCKSLVIMPNTSVTIDAGNALTVENVFLNNGRFEFFSDTTSSGTFICNGTESGNGTNVYKMALSGKNINVLNR